MCRIFTRLVCLVGLILLSNQMVVAQNITISGTVTDKTTNEPLIGVAIIVKGKARGSLTNQSGEFKLTTTEKAPLTIVVSYIGYKTFEQTINGSVTNLAIQLEEEAVLGQEVVVSASRTPERILESPVSIERAGITAIKESAAPSFYDALVNMKGVESSTQSLTFRSINTRGFNANGNVRFNQFIDGMDNQAPGLNFSVGNIVGISDMDIESAELLPGASSALYGAGGTNGTLVMTSKSPFTYPGLSFSYKVGANHVDNRQRTAAPYEDMSIRYAKSWNDKFALKTNISYIQAQDWQAQNYADLTVAGGTRQTDPAYDGVNSYADEINNFYFGSPFTFLNNQKVSRTGYLEKDLVDYGTKSFKTSNSLHYKFGNGLEAIAQANWGTGTSVYTGTARYSLRNFSIGQYKLELKGNDFFVRAYTTRENSGDTFQATALASWINELWSPSRILDGAGNVIGGWFVEYGSAYQNARAGGQTDAAAHIAARAFADRNRLIPGTAAFNSAAKQIASTPIGKGASGSGAKFNDKSNLYHYEGMYNFSKMLNNVVDVLAGASFRRYNLHSEGTLFNDMNGGLSIDEYGGYVQVGKKLFEEKLKLSASGRYDKSQNFEGRVTPRVSAVYTVAPNNNIRVSYQTGFRNPTTQNQYIDLLVGDNRLVGGLAALLDKYQLRTNQVYTSESVELYRTSVRAGAPNTDLLQKWTFSDLKPESVQAYEIGYKGLLTNRLLFDVSYYYNNYKDFIADLVVVKAANPAASLTGQKFTTTVNSPGKVEAHGVALGLDYKIGKFNLTGNVSYNNLINNSSTLINDFNTPKYRFNVGVASREIVKNVSFNTVYRWQDKFTWTSTFLTGEVPAFGTLDAQVSLKVPTYNSTIKLGATNLLNKYYVTSYGNPEVGGLYYVSLVFDQFMR